MWDLKDKYKECCHNDDCESFGTCIECWDEWAERNPPMTNADRIRSMSDEELAKYLTDKTEYQPSPGARKSWGGAYGNSYLEYHEAALDWLYWLQQPAEVSL